MVLANAETRLSQAFDEICSIDLEDGFVFSRLKIGPLIHPHMDYTGTEVILIWSAYHHGLSLKQGLLPPAELEKVIDSINQWLIAHIAAS